MASLSHRMQAALGSIKDYRERRRLERGLAAMQVAVLAGMEPGWADVYGEAVARGGAAHWNDDRRRKCWKARVRR